MKSKSVPFLAVWFVLCLLALHAHAWETEVVDRPDTGGNASALSIAVDTHGAAHISSFNGSLHALQYTTNATGS